MLNFTRTILIVCFLLVCQQLLIAQTATISGNITDVRALSADTVYTLEGKVYIKDGGVMFVPPGTIIRGDKDSKGMLICTKTGILAAQGTPEQPIIFTSSEAIGERQAGDWGGLVFCGNAGINATGGSASLPGLDAADGAYGGANAFDSRGGLQYVRIEYGGGSSSPANKLAGLTLAGVGLGTLIENVMVSYSGDDAFEIRGGTMNAKYLVANGSVDDDFETDLGWTGNIQFAVGYRDPSIGDASGSNGFESDNDDTGSANTPKTNGVFSNVTLLGPIQDIFTEYDANYKRAAHLKNNTELKFFNSILGAFPVGLMVDGMDCEANADLDFIKVKNSAIAIITDSFVENQLLETQLGSLWNIESWYNTPEFDNFQFDSISGIGFVDPFNATKPDLRFESTSTLAVVGASFDDTDLDPTFFIPTTYIGAFGQVENWFGCWVNFIPQETNYDFPGTTLAPTIAFFSFETDSGSLTIDFVNLSSSSDAYFWNFGIDSINTDTSSLVNPSFTFPDTGTYFIQLIAYGCTVDTFITELVITQEGGLLIDDISYIGEFKIFPNPANDRATIEIYATKTTEGLISIYDLKGQMMLESIRGQLSPGTNHINMDLQTLNPGVYIVYVFNNGIGRSERLIIQ